MGELCWDGLKGEGVRRWEAGSGRGLVGWLVELSWLVACLLFSSITSKDQPWSLIQRIHENPPLP